MAQMLQMVNAEIIERGSLHGSRLAGVWKFLQQFLYTKQERGGAVRSSLFGDAFSFEHVEWEVLVGHPHLDIQQEVQ